MSNVSETKPTAAFSIDDVDELNRITSALTAFQHLLSDAADFEDKAYETYSLLAPHIEKLQQINARLQGVTDTVRTEKGGVA